MSPAWVELHNMYCTRCGKKDTRNRIVNEITKICSVCEPAHPDQHPSTSTVSDEEQLLQPPSCDVDDNETLDNIRFGTLKKWLNDTFTYHVAQMDERLTREIGAVKAELQTTKSALDVTTKDVTDLKNDISDFRKTTNDGITNAVTRVSNMEAEMKKQKTVSDNNLKYLINLDRNERRRNVILFGVPEENNELKIVDNTAVSDREKIELILNYMGVPTVQNMTEFFRLGKPSDEKVRPMKLKLKSSEDATEILNAKSKLNDLEELTIYFKPDKTKAEVAEFQRIGKRKQELLQKYPVEGGAPTRVVLEKGVLKVDGKKVDEFEPVQSLF